MKLVGALTACLVFGAAHGRLSLTQKLKRMAAESAAKAAKAMEAAEAEARNQRSAGSAVTVVGKVEQQKPLTDDGIDALAQEQAEIHALTSRHASKKNHVVQNAVDIITDEQLVSLLNNPFYNAFSMVDLNNYKGSPWESSIYKSIGEHSSKVARIGLALSTGSPVILYVKELMQEMNMAGEVIDLTKRGHEYTNFMQECEEVVAGMFFKLYSVFAASRSAASDLGVTSTFQTEDKEVQKYMIEEASYSLTKAGKYIEEIVDLVKEMIEKSENLKDKMQSKVGDITLTHQTGKLGDTEFAEKITHANAHLEKANKRKQELEQMRVSIDADIADLEERMQASSSALQAKMQARSDLLKNIIPEKREGSPAHWRMFYEELCSWFAEWDCKFDATNVFQWVVDPTPIKALYVEATKEIEELEQLHEQRISSVAELLEIRKENTKLIIEFAELTGDMLNQISQNKPAIKHSGATDILWQLAIRKLDQVALTFGAIKTAFEYWKGNIVSQQDKQADAMRQIKQMPEETNKKLIGKAHKKTMKILSEQLLDCAVKGMEAWGSMEDIEYYRTFFMTTIINYDQKQLEDYIDDQDIDQVRNDIKQRYRQEVMSKKLASV